MTREEFEKFIATDEGKALIEEQKKPLISKRDELLEVNSKIKEKYRVFDELGDVETLKNILKEHNETKEKIKQKEIEDSKKTGNFEALEKSLREELGKKEQSVELFKSKAIDARVNNELTSAITEAKGVTELLKPILANRVKGKFNDEGDIELEVFDDAGKPLYINGEPAKVKDLIEALKANEVYGRAFEGTGSSGSGTRNTHGKPNVGGVILDPKKDGYSVSKAMEYYAKNPQALKK